jgi:hypothetical protein
MNGGEYNATNIPATIPACPTGGIVFFSIGGELCCYDGNTAKQITDDGNIPYEELDGVTLTMNMQGICHDGTSFVGVSTAGGVYTSTDGETWTLVASLGALAIPKIIYANGVYVISSPAQLYTSTDATTWTSRSITNTVDVCYGNGIFLAVSPTSPAGHIYTSSDGVTWTTHSFSGEIFRSACFGNGLFVISGNGNYKIYTTTDGASLTTYTTAYAGCDEMEYGDGVYVASLPTGGLIYSANGATWTQVSSVTDFFSGMCYNGYRWFAVGGDDYYYTSENGITWTSHAITLAHSLYRVYFNNTLTVAVGDRVALSFPKYKTLE